MNINVTWTNADVPAPAGTVIDHADVDLLDGADAVVASQVGAAGSGLPTSSSFPDVAIGTGYKVRLRNMSAGSVQFGADVMTNKVDVGSGGPGDPGDITVSVVGSGVATSA